MRHALALLVIAVALLILSWSLIISALTARKHPKRASATPGSAAVPAPAHRPRHARKRKWAPVKGVTCLRVRLVPAVTRHLTRPQAEQARQQQSGQAS